MNSVYRELLEKQVRDMLIKKLAHLLSMFNPYEPIYKEIKKDIKKLILAY